MFEDPSYDFLRHDVWAALDRAMAKVSGDLDSVNPDLRAFRARGGKLIQYHGWNDPAIPARTSRSGGVSLLNGRASTPPDAARLIVPDARQELENRLFLMRVTEEFLETIDEWRTKAL